MISILPLSIGIILGAIRASEEESLKKYMKQHAKEDQKWGEEKSNQLLKSGWDRLFDPDDLLPDEDKGKQFEPNVSPSLENVSKTALNTPEIADLLKRRPRSHLEEAEPFFQVSRSVFEDPTANAGILSTNAQVIPEEVRFVNCEEAGTYQIAFEQTRKVEVIPEVKKQIHRCLGHAAIDNQNFWTSSGAEELAKKKRQELAKDLSIESYAVKVEKSVSYKVISQWSHKDNTPNCRAFSIEDVIVQPSSEKDTWETDSPGDLSYIEGNPNCRLLYSQIIEGPAVRSIGEKAVFRDVWKRRLLFSCEPTGESPCAKLREQGGTLVKKRCKKENHFGECDLWEKTYDLGKKAAHQEFTHQFEKEEIWGLNGIFEDSHEKNKELPSVVASLSVFSEMEKELEKSGQLSEENVEIFRGERMKCQCSFIKGVLYDCCKKMNGLAVSTYLAACNSEEKSLAQQRYEGRCHHVGSMKENLGMQTTQVFCCFQTKLARILHEQGRAQLGIGWGTAEEPICRGFSLNELQQIDLTRIDFTDVFEDMAIDKEELLGKIRATVDTLQLNGNQEAQANTAPLTQMQQEGLLHVAH